MITFSGVSYEAMRSDAEAVRVSDGTLLALGDVSLQLPAGVPASFAQTTAVSATTK